MATSGGSNTGQAAVGCTADHPMQGVYRTRLLEFSGPACFDGGLGGGSLAAAAAAPVARIGHEGFRAALYSYSLFEGILDFDKAVLVTSASATTRHRGRGHI